MNILFLVTHITSILELLALTASMSPCNLCMSGVADGPAVG